MKPKCIICDSSSDHSETIASLAKNTGFEVLIITSWKDAPAAEELSNYDILFLEVDPQQEDWVAPFSDNRLADNTEIFVMTQVDNHEVADRVIKAGASYYFCKPLNEEYLTPLLQDIAAEIIEKSTDVIPAADCGIDQFGQLRGSSRSMMKLYRHIRKVSKTDASVMVIGESGTGKELVARTVHMMSPRREMPFIAFNCAAVPEHLIESELFGHEKGAFSGAVRRHHGYFERAQGGTLLLDEITEMDINLQAKLLRVLETKTVRRLGSEENIELDVRIISATNRSPEDSISDGRLREDLYYRLAQFPLRSPPLSQRGPDVVGLANYFLRDLNTNHSTDLAFSEAALESIQKYTWPGNVREMKHVLERAYILSDKVIDRELQLAIEAQNSNQPQADDGINLAVGTTIAEAERRLILATLEDNNDDKQASADILGISLKTLYNRLKDYTE